MNKFGIESIGIVANDKEPTSKIIKVFPSEQLAEYEGVITDTDDKKDSSSNIISSGSALAVGSLDRKMIIEAEWIDLSGGNRVTAPDVKKGESVMLYKMGDASRWFWTPMRNESDLRRKESVVKVYGNTEEHGKTLDNSNSYYTVMDTKNKKIQLHTANNDGEAVGFDIIIDTKLGTIEIKDTNGNFLKHDGKNGTLETKHSKQVTIRSPKIILDGEVETTKNLKVAETIHDEKGDLTYHEHAVVNHSLAKKR